MDGNSYPNKNFEISEIINQDIIITHPVVVPEDVAKDKNIKWKSLDFLIDLIKKSEKTIFYFWKTTEKEYNSFKIGLINRIDKKYLDNILFGVMIPYLPSHFCNLKDKKVPFELMNLKEYYSKRRNETSNK